MLVVAGFILVLTCHQQQQWQHDGVHIHQLCQGVSGCWVSMKAYAALTVAAHYGRLCGGQLVIVCIFVVLVGVSMGAAFFWMQDCVCPLCAFVGAVVITQMW